MRISLSADNPFGYSPKGLVWELLRVRCQPGHHLDYGTYDGEALLQFSRARLIKSGVGLDVNQEVIDRSRGRMPANVELCAIRKNAPIDLEPGSFDTASLIGVVEHVHDQKHLLRKLHLLLKKHGVLLIAVPGKHLLSFLDMGNLKFVFPTAHRLAYSFLHSGEEYQKRYVECRNGLFGDIETEKMWHEHFTSNSMRRLLHACGFELLEWDGQGFFQRFLVDLAYFTPTFMKPPLRRMIAWDARIFHSAELVFLARKAPLDDANVSSRSEVGGSRA